MEEVSNISNKIPPFLLLILVCMLVLLPLCSGRELVTEKQVITEKQVVTYYDVFEDENENWKARYELNETHVFIKTNRKTHYYGEHDNHLFVTYKGNLSESSSPKRIQISYDTGYGGGELCDDFNGEEYVLKSYSGSGSIEMQGPIYSEWGSMGIQWLSLVHNINPVWIKEQMPVFGHTISPVCVPYKTVYVHHEASGGTKVGKDDTIRVTIKLDGETETLELRSAQ